MSVELFLFDSSRSLVSFLRLIDFGDRTEWSPNRPVILREININKIGRLNSGSPICLITRQVPLQTELDDRKSCYQLIMTKTKFEGKRGRGRPRVTRMKNIKEWLRYTYNGCVRRAEDRNSWRSMIADLLLVDGT